MYICPFVLIIIIIIFSYQRLLLPLQLRNRNHITFQSWLHQCFMLSLELWSKLKRIQMEICFVCWWLPQPERPIILDPLFFFLMRPSQPNPLWLSSVVDLFAQEECLQPPLAKWHRGHVRYSLGLCYFFSNEPSNSYFIMPEANWEKGGVILVPVGRLPLPSLRPLL